MKRILLLFTVLIIVYGFAPASFAYFSSNWSDNVDDYDQSGVFLGKFDENNDNDLDLIFSHIVDVFNANSIAYDFSELYLIDKLEITDNDILSGEWWTNDVDQSVSFFTVKAGKAYTLYWLDSATADATTGMWNTSLLTNKHGKPQGTSHISFWTTDASPLQAVPEPMTAVLLMSGLLGLALTGRKFRNQS